MENESQQEKGNNQKKKVLDVGQCNPDHRSIKRLIESFGAEVQKAALPKEAMLKLQNEDFDLVLVNRKIDQNYSDGIELVKEMKSDKRTRNIPIMLISNHPEAHSEAISLGAEQGFGKDHLSKPGTRKLLEKYLTRINQNSLETG